MMFSSKRIIAYFIPLLILCSCEYLMAQEGYKEHEEIGAGTHKFTFCIAQVYFQKHHAEDFKSSVIPAYTFNYDYMLNSRWSLGSHNDIPLQGIEKIEEGEALIPNIVTEHPVATKFVAAYHAAKHLGLMFGMGDEISKHENVLLSSIGADYSLHLSSKWEVGAELVYDMKYGATDSWVLGFGLTRVIGRHHKG